jgi:hypothetical protein
MPGLPSLPPLRPPELSDPEPPSPSPDPPNVPDPLNDELGLLPDVLLPVKEELGVATLLLGAAWADWTHIVAAAVMSSQAATNV